MKLLFLTSGPQVPSTRFRVLQWLPLLEAEGHQCVVAHSWPDKYQQSPWLGFRLSQRARRWKRQLDLKRASRGGFDVVVLERELFNDDTSDLELAFRRVAKRMVLDIDDGIFLTWPAKFESVAGAVDHVIAGNDLLAAESRKFAGDVSVVPTCVDVSRYPTRVHRPAEVPVIGWTGTSSNLQYFSLIRDALHELALLTPFKLVILADEKARDVLPSIPAVTTEFISWSVKNETAALLHFDVGIMPLPDERWSRLKCGFKLLQYMAAGLPAVASPVGVNSQIILPGITGELATSTADWVRALSTLLIDAERRKSLGQAGRNRVDHHYSLASNWRRWRAAVLGERP